MAGRKQAAAGLIVMLLTGCASWQAPAVDSHLPKPKVAQNAVIIETACVACPEDRDLEQAIWRELDEQYLDPATRARLAANGIRCGVVGSNLPTALRELLEVTPSKVPVTFARSGSAEESSTNHSEPHEGATGTLPTINPVASVVQRQRLTVVAGDRTELVVSPVLRPSIAFATWTTRGDVSQEFRNARAQFQLAAEPVGRGARLTLTPEVRHGEVRQRFVGLDSGFAFAATPDSQPFPDLQIVAELSVGQMLVLSAMPTGDKFGHVLFDVEPNSSRCSLLLIRLAETRHDDLFGAGDVPQPLATPLGVSPPVLR